MTVAKGRRAAALVATTAVAVVMAACGGDDGDEGPFTLVPTTPGAEACAYEAEPTPELDAAKAGLEDAGYRVRYGGYAELGYFTDESESEELCADSVLAVERRGLDELDRFLIRQYDDPERFEQGVGDLEGNGLTTAEREPLFYFYAGPKQAVVDEVVAAAEGSPPG